MKIFKNPSQVFRPEEDHCNPSNLRSCKKYLLSNRKCHMPPKKHQDKSPHPYRFQENNSALSTDKYNPNGINSTGKIMPESPFFLNSIVRNVLWLRNKPGLIFYIIFCEYY